MRRAVSCWVLGIVLMGTGTAFAAAKTCPARPDNTEEARDLAGEYFSRGTELFAQRKYDAALAAFMCSLQLADHENTVLNLAACLRNTNKKKAALQPLRKYVRQNPNTTSAAELRLLIHSAETSLKLPHSELPAPSEPLVEQPSPLADPEPDPQPEPEAEDSGPDDPIVAFPELSQASVPEPSRLKEVLSWSAIGVGGVALIASPVLFGLSGAARDEAKTASNTADFQDSRNKMHGLRAGGYVALAAGVTLIAAGLIMLLVPGSSEAVAGRGQAKVELSAGMTHQGVVLIGRF